MIEINPFDDLIVNEPRQREPAVTGLNEKPLQALLAQFQRLAEGAPPHPPRRLPHAQLITSIQPGFGKSHLIGRLFKSLHERATLIYVRPFQNPALAFQSLMATAVKEMNFPDRMDADAWRPSEPTQMDELACSVLAHLLADLIDDQSQVEALRSDPVNAFGQGLETDVWGKWMHDHFRENRAAFEQALTRRHIELNSPEWLRVLFAYAFKYPDREIRQAALDWITGLPLSVEQGELLGLRPAELLAAESPAEALNEASRLRLIDLCRLASFYRPFVFCFDQTESYGHAPALARSFGMVVASLVNDAHNHLTLVTSNQAPWKDSIAAFFEDADRQRIAHPPLVLSGLTRAQGEELIRLRLEGCDAREMLGPMLADEWLGREFRTAQDHRATRRFLQMCKERWEELRHRPKAPPVKLEQMYEERRLKLLADPKRLLLDADALEWLVKQCANGLPNVTIYQGAGYFTVGWQTSAIRVLFGFEAGSNWKRWTAIARHAQDRAAKNPPLKVVLFRDSTQMRIPDPEWKVAGEINAAKQECMHVIVLSREDLAALYAGYDLYSEALGGDISPHSAQDVLTFLQRIFAPWWQRFTGPIDGQIEPPRPNRADEKALATRVRDIVAQHKFLAIDEVIARLGTPTTQEAVLQACRYHAAIRVHVHPKMTVLQWQSL